MNEEKELEELLKLASQDVQIVEEKKIEYPKNYFRSDFNNFFTTTGLAPGPLKISLTSIYEAYTKYSDTPMSTKEFWNLLSERLLATPEDKRKRYKKRIYCNMKNTELQKKAAEAKRKRHEKNKKEDEKIDGKISSTS